MTLLERHTHLAELAAAERDAAAGRGSLVLVTGEAGIGKTALVREFAEHAAASVRWGMCDELLTPRPLGPFQDMFGDAIRIAEPAALLDAISGVPDGVGLPAVAVVEDAHWADQATVDALRFIARRIGRRRAVLVVTYRDDEVPADHALRLAVGAVPADDVRRIRLAPLSRDAVGSLTRGTGIDPGRLHALTGGNPFYVAESLAHQDSAVPPSVQDAVMARVGRLDSTGRECAEVASVVPSAAELALLQACGVDVGLDEAYRRGVLRMDGDVVRFSHEIARRAVERALPETRRVEINGRLLDALTVQGADPARLTHHAVGAGRVDAIVRHAPLAAEQAAAAGACREAFDHFSQALEYAERFTTDALIGLLEGAARNGCHAARFQEARSPAERAVLLHRERQDWARLGVALCELSRIEWDLGHGEAAHAAADEAIAVLRTDGDGAPDGLAFAYALQARLAMLDHRPDEAIAWGEKAVQLFERAGNHRPVQVLVTIGTAALQRDPADLRLATALRLALDAGNEFAAARAYCNLADELTLHMRYDRARQYIDDGLVYVDSEDDFAGYDHLLAVRSQWHLDQGHWPDAERDARRVLDGRHEPSAIRAKLMLALVQARRGDAASVATAADAYARATAAAEAQHVIPAGLLRAELAWLSGDREGIATALRSVCDEVRQAGLSRWSGEARLWEHRCGAEPTSLGPVPEPYVLHMAGRWRDAANLWTQLGRPYEAADVLADSDEPELVLEAVAVLDRLGAKPRAAMARQRLVELGVHSVPRGPRPMTRANPAGLTARQVEVLELLAESLTYRGIADRLHLSVKTVDHHVAAIRTKLGVGSRAEAVETARNLGVLS